MGKSSSSRWGQRLTWSAVRTRMGWCGAVFEGKRLIRFFLPASKGVLAAGIKREYRQAEEAPMPGGLSKDIVAYFEGKRVSFRYPLRLIEVSGFEQAVLEEVKRIPYGAAASYGEIARRVGKPGGARAVGRVMGKNPIPLIIPCHRVVASGGKIGGFSAPGGIKLKKKMLMLEGVVAS